MVLKMLVSSPFYQLTWLMAQKNLMKLSCQESSRSYIIFQTWKKKFVTMILAVIVGGGKTGYEGTSPHSLPQMNSH
jgi:hypothetical protein